MVMPTENLKIEELENREAEIKKQIEVLFQKQQELSRQSTSVQFEIIELKGELKGLEKIINLLREK